MHLVEPLLSVNSPFLHGSHFNCPSEFVNEFFGHGSHAASPIAALNVPGAHLTHASNIEIPPFLDPLYPAGQPLHFVCSTRSL